MDFPDPGIEPGSPALQADSLPAELSGKSNTLTKLKKKLSILVVKTAEVQIKAVPELIVLYQFPGFNNILC